MQSQVLFPSHKDLNTYPNRIEPSAWIRRLHPQQIAASTSKATHTRWPSDERDGHGCLCRSCMRDTEHCRRRQPPKIPRHNTQSTIELLR